MVQDKITVATWNVCNGLGESRTTALPIAQVVAKLDPRPDVMFFPEATNGESIDLRALNILEQLGRVSVSPYNDPDNRADTHASVAMYSPEVADLVDHRGREAFFYISGKIAVAGMHGFDRMRGVDGNQVRINQMQRVLNRAKDMDMPTSIIMGDLNALNPGTAIAGWLRHSGPMIRRLHAREPDGSDTIRRMGDVVSLMQRLASYAEGGSYEELLRQGYAPTGDRSPTKMFPFGLGGVRIDHIMYTGDSIYDLRDVATTFAPRCSDHACITATWSV